ncbi:hypothetical protein Asp14428_65470 [Actinoplanes sp. NBRC 14428]|nr:hypothetical protein Asp14428_65470 [Actinoplanes sp. NBRC 14428]
MAAHPVTLAPGKPSGPPPAPTGLVATVKAVLTRRAPAAVRSHGGRVEGDGMSKGPER